jgi:hypothetical protein
MDKVQKYNSFNSHVVKKLPAFYGTRRFIAMFTRAELLRVDEGTLLGNARSSSVNYAYILSPME